MSNRPKGFKRMPIFRFIEEPVKKGKNIIFEKVIDKRLPKDELYHRQIIQIKNSITGYNDKHIGSKRLKNIYLRLRILCG